MKPPLPTQIEPVLPLPLLGKPQVHIPSGAAKLGADLERHTGAGLLVLPPVLPPVDPPVVPPVLAPLQPETEEDGMHAPVMILMAAHAAVPPLEPLGKLQAPVAIFNVPGVPLID